MHYRKNPETNIAEKICLHFLITAHLTVSKVYGISYVMQLA